MATKTQAKNGRQTLTRKDIEKRVGQRSFDLGKEYFRCGAIFDCRRQDQRIRAQCEGSYAAAYRVEAELGKNGIRSAHCTCPVGGGGHCKHTAAMLLAWLDSPEKFREQAEVRARLEKRTKAELISLIEQWIEQDPELEDWLELTEASDDAVAVEVYQRRAEQAFNCAGYGWEADTELTHTLDQLRRLGDQFFSDGKVASAASVYIGILKGFVAGYESFHDETGNVVGEAMKCITSLAECLGAQSLDAAARKETLETLFDILAFDIDYGGISLGDDVPEILLDQASDEERGTITQWIRRAIEESDGDSTTWGHSYWGSLLLEFETESRDDEAYLEHCRKYGLTTEVVSRLFELDRFNEAMKEIRKASDHQIPQFANMLVASKRTDEAETLVRERIEASEHRSLNLVEWLQRFYESNRNWTAALELELDSFRQHPSLAAYQSVRRYAKKAKSWKSLRPEVMQCVYEDGNAIELIRIHLDEKELEAALEVYRAADARRAWGWESVEMDLANAVQKSHPDEAIDIYRALAARLINRRGRENYRAACDQLKKVRKVYRSQDREDEWSEYVNSLKAENSKLRALHDEMRLAKL